MPKSFDIIYRYTTPVRDVAWKPTSADAAIRRLNDGSEAFARLLADPSEAGAPLARIVELDLADLGLLSGKGSAPRQRPFAAILGCSDARVPIELIFNEGPNDLFVIRVAGNGLGDEVLGSLRYAVEQLGDSMKLIAVLGHSGCGAVSAAVDVFLSPGAYLSLVTKHSLRGILDRLLLVVQTTARKLTSFFGPQIVESGGYRQALIEASVVTNAAFVAHSLQNE